MEVLHNGNFLLYAARHCDCYDSEEFLEDLKRFKYIKKLITRFHETRRVEGAIDIKPHYHS